MCYLNIFITYTGFKSNQAAQTIPIYSANKANDSANVFADKITRFADKNHHAKIIRDCCDAYLLSLYMPFQFKNLFLYFLAYHLLWEFSMSVSGNNIVAYLNNSFGSYKAIGLEITTSLSFFLYALSAYFFLWFFYKNKKILPAILLILLSIPLVILFRYFLEEIFAPLFLGFRNYNPDVKLAYYVQDNKFFAVPNIAFGFVFYFVQSNRYKEAEKNELIIQNRQAELDYLKSQINPHFLFNNLNTIYALVYHQSDKALFAIEKLADLLRYMLYNKTEKVLVAEEVNYLQSFIALQKLRQENEFPLIANIEIADKKAKIAPLLLIPLVENAFKHGCFKDRTDPLKIDLRATSTTIQFIVCNKKSSAEKDPSSGIGIANLKKRLELLYPNSFKLYIDEDQCHYKTTLNINL